MSVRGTGPIDENTWIPLQRPRTSYVVQTSLLDDLDRSVKQHFLTSPCARSAPPTSPSSGENKLAICNLSRSRKARLRLCVSTSLLILPPTPDDLRSRLWPVGFTHPQGYRGIFGGIGATIDLQPTPVAETWPGQVSEMTKALTQRENTTTAFISITRR